MSVQLVKVRGKHIRHWPYTDEEAERKARKVRDILIGEVVMILHNSDDLNSADQDILSGNVCQTLTEYFDDEYGV